MKNKLNLTLLLLGLAVLTARAQPAVPPLMYAYPPLSAAQLDQLLGPIALYPDPLIAEILPASTLPAQIVLADRYINGGGDPNQIGWQPWDPSVQALARYPSVLKWMDDNLNWTTQLGQAFLNQQQDVMDSIQRLRTLAFNEGNLQSTPQQQVINDDGYIEILPANPDVMCVPVYQPDEVYYQTDYGPPFITFGIGWPIGPWLCCDFDWRHHNLIFWSQNYPRPANWWREPPDQRTLVAGQATVWHPANRPAYPAANEGDRGWNNPVVNRSALSVNRSAPAPVEHNEPASRPESNGAFIGVQSARDTRAFSARGQESVQTMAPAPPPSGGGGGGRR